MNFSLLEILLQNIFLVIFKDFCKEILLWIAAEGFPVFPGICTKTPSRNLFFFHKLLQWFSIFFLFLQDLVQKFSQLVHKDYCCTNSIRSYIKKCSNPPKASYREIQWEIFTILGRVMERIFTRFSKKFS